MENFLTSYVLSHLLLVNDRSSGDEAVLLRRSNRDKLNSKCARFRSSSLRRHIVENHVRRNPQRGSFVRLVKVWGIIGGFSKENGNRSKHTRFFELCCDYVNSAKMSTAVLLIKRIVLPFNFGSSPCLRRRCRRS